MADTVKCTVANLITPKFTDFQSNLTANFTFILYTLFTLTCAIFYTVKQRRRLKEKETLATKFNAGGEMSISMLSSTIVSQWTWAASLLQSTSVGTNYGLSGSYWYGSGACIQILLFAIVCMEMRIKAPGARTFLQIIQVRFDKKTHILYCVFALLTNAIVTAMLLVGGIASLSYSFPGVSGEYAILLYIISMSLYVFVGGLGGLFYVSYFSTLAILLAIIILFMNTFYSSSSATSTVGNIDAIFARYSCISNPKNYASSYKTFASLDGLMFGIINIIGNFGTVFVDQSYWQLNSNASPKKSSIAFIIAGSIWFFIPFCFGTTMSVGYTFLQSFSTNTSILSSGQISAGLVAPTVAGINMGRFGNFIVNLIVIFAVTTTGGGEIIAVTSIIINDIIAVYVNPFNAAMIENKDSLVCILCQKVRGKVGNNKCLCSSITNCKECDHDNEQIKRMKMYARKCEMHGKYLSYENYLNTRKNYTMIAITLIMLIVALLLYYINLSLGWLYSWMGIIVGPAVIPITLCLFWARINSFSMFMSLIAGVISGLVSWIVTTYAMYRSFDLNSSGELIPMLVGNCFSIGISGILVVILTFVTARPLNVDQMGEVWEKTRDIDSPLLPWTEIYAKEINIENAQELKGRPSLLEVESQLRTVKRFSWALSISLTFFLIIIWPIFMLNFGDYSSGIFKFWIIIAQIFVYASFLYTLLSPFLEMVYNRYFRDYFDKIFTGIKLRKNHNENKKPSSKNKPKREVVFEYKRNQRDSDINSDDIYDDENTASADAVEEGGQNTEPSIKGISDLKVEKTAKSFLKM